MVSRPRYHNHDWNNCHFFEPFISPGLFLGFFLLLIGLCSMHQSFLPIANAQVGSFGAKHVSLNELTNSSSSPGQDGQILTNNDTVIVKQETSTSEPAPVRHPGQPLHEVVFALPLRDDGKVWSGRATFAASKPIEVEVLHMYQPSENVDGVHGEPYLAVLPGNRTIAISHFRNLVDIPIEINGTGMSSGTLEFTGSALVFHKTTGEPFTVTYTIDAQAKSLNQ